MKLETALGAKLASKGITANGVELQRAIAKFQNNGGTWEVAYAILCAAYKREGGRAHIVDEGRSTDAPLPPNAGGSGLLNRADAARGHLPLPSAKNATDGQLPNAPTKASTCLPAVAAKLPGHARRGAAAIAVIQPTVAKSLFDATMLPDGRPLRKVRWSECPNLAKRYRYLARILLGIHLHAVPSDPNSYVDTVLSEDQLYKIINKVESAI